MTFTLPAREYDGTSRQPRVSPISRSASFVTFGLLIIGIVSSIATGFNLASLPNIVLMVTGVVLLDVMIQLLPRSRIVEAIQICLYGFLYLATTCVCGILAAYAMQRFAFPLRDQLLQGMDRSLGFDWFAYAHWVDSHPVVQAIFFRAYNTIFPQVALPLIVLAFSNRVTEVREYLLALAIAFICTIIVSALMPAAGPIVFVDRSAFNLLHFTGATPIDHLMRLREAGPLILNDDPGGIATFPSFHATIAIMTPLTLRKYRFIFIALLFLDAAMLGATLTEGAHYLTDIIAGTWMAFFGHAMAKRLINRQQRSLPRYG